MLSEKTHKHGFSVNVSGSLLLIITTALLIFIVSTSVLAHHISIGRWSSPECSLAREIEIIIENDNYAILLKNGNRKHELRAIELISKEAKGSFIFKDPKKYKAKVILYKINSTKRLDIYLDDTLDCSGRPLSAKRNSVID